MVGDEQDVDSDEPSAQCKNHVRKCHRDFWNIVGGFLRLIFGDTEDIT